MIKLSFFLFFLLSLLMVLTFMICTGCSTISDPEMTDQVNNWNGVYNIGGALTHANDTQIAQLNQIAQSLPADAAAQSALITVIAGALAHANDAQAAGLQALAIGSVGGLGGTPPGSAATPPAIPAGTTTVPSPAP